MLVIVNALNLVVVIDSGMFAEICMQRKIQMCIYFIDIFDMWHVYVAERDTAHVKIMHTVRASFSFIVIKELFILTHNMHSLFTAPYYYTPASEKEPWIMWEFFPSCLNKKNLSQLFQYSIPEYCIASCNNCSFSLQVRHNKQHGVSNYQQVDCLFNRLLMLISKKTSEPAFLVLCEGNTTVTGGFPSRGKGFHVMTSTKRCSDIVVVTIVDINHRYHSLIHGNGLSPVKRFTITCTNFDPVHWLIYASPVIKVLSAPLTWLACVHCFMRGNCVYTLHRMSQY